MKNCIMFLIVIAPVFLSAQFNVNIDESAKTFSKGSNPAYEFELTGSHLEKAQKDWMSYQSKGAKGKTAVINGEVVTLSAVNANISATPFNIYSRLLETTTGVKITAWVTINNDSVYMSNAVGDKNLAVEKYLHDFAAQEYRDVVKSQLKDENQKLKKLQEQLKDFIDQQESSTKKSNEFQRSINNNKDKIKVNEGDQANKQSQISNQKQVVEDLKANPGATLDAAKKTLSQYEKDLTKLINEKEKLFKEIDKWAAKIDSQNRETNAALDGQKMKYNEIDAQKAVVQAVQNKLDAIN